jgi:alanine racemase
VRSGIFLYGISSIKNVSGQELGFKPVLALISKIVAIQEVKKGEAIGYGSTWVCPKITRVGVVAIGYGDGYSWHIKPKSQVLIGSFLCPIIGKVSMDYLAVDLIKIPKINDC